MSTRFEKALPLAGIAAGISMGAATFLQGDAPRLDGDGSASSFVSWYADNQGAVFGSAIATGLLGVLLLFYVTGLRARLRSGEGGEGTYSAAAYAGGIATAVALAAWAGYGAALGDAAKAGHEEAALALGYLGDMAWLPWVVGTSVLMVSTGLGGLRSAVLPKWFSVISLVLGVAALLGPVGIGVYMVSPLYYIAGGVVLSRRTAAPAPVPAYA
jgi:hypothetical protein